MHLPLLLPNIFPINFLLFYRFYRMHMALLYMLVIIHCHSLVVTAGCINPQYEQKQELERQLAENFQREQTPKTSTADSGSMVAMGTSSKTTTSDMRKDVAGRELPQIQQTADINKSKPLATFLRKLWQQRFNPFFSQMEKESHPDLNKRRLIFDKNNLLANDDSMSDVRRMSFRRNWMPETDHSKHSSVKKKGKGGIGVWGRRRELLGPSSNTNQVLARQILSQIQETDDGEEGEIKKDMLLMLINGLEK